KVGRGHTRSPKCVRKRPKGVQRSERLRKYLNARAEGGRFELQGRPTTTSPTRARKCWRHNDCRGVSGRAWMVRKNPKEPAKTRPEALRLHVHDERRGARPQEVAAGEERAAPVAVRRPGR